MKNKEIFSLVIASILLILVLIIAIIFKCPTNFQYFTLRTCLALSCGLFAFLIAGKIKIEYQVSNLIIEATAGMGIFTMVYFLNPAKIIVNQNCGDQSVKIMVFIDGKTKSGVNLSIPSIGANFTTNRDGLVILESNQLNLTSYTNIHILYSELMIDTTVSLILSIEKINNIILNKNVDCNPKYYSYWEKWKLKNTDLVQQFDLENARISSENIFQQVFAGGRILLSQSGWAKIIKGDEYKNVALPLELVAQSTDSGWIVNYPVVEKLLSEVDNANHKKIYREYCERKLIVGGIGTIYLREQLYTSLSAPLSKENPNECEYLFEGCLVVSAKTGFTCIIGLPNINNVDNWICNLIFIPNHKLNTSGQVSKEVVQEKMTR